MADSRHIPARFYVIGCGYVNINVTIGKKMPQNFQLANMNVNIGGIVIQQLFHDDTHV